jgi:hypothetical protein
LIVAWRPRQIPSESLSQQSENHRIGKSRGGLEIAWSHPRPSISAEATDRGRWTGLLKGKLANRVRRIIALYFRAGPIPLYLIALSFIVAVGSLVWGLDRDAGGFLNNLLVELTVIGTGVVVTNVLLAGLQRTRQVNALRGLLRRITQDAEVVFDLLYRALGLPPEPSRLPGAERVNRTVSIQASVGGNEPEIVASHLVHTLGQRRDELASVADSGPDQSTDGLLDAAMIERIRAKVELISDVAKVDLQEVTQDPMFPILGDELVKKVTPWTNKAYADLSVGNRSRLLSPAGIRDASDLLLALENLLRKAVDATA